MRMRTRSVDQRTAIAVAIRSAVFVTLVLVARAGGADGDDGLRCWLRTSAGAIRVGEPFSLVVTCQAADTEGLSIVVDESKLDPTTVQFRRSTCSAVRARPTSAAPACGSSSTNTTCGS